MYENHDLSESTSTIRLPSWLGLDFHEERELPLASDAYRIVPGGWWTVTVAQTGDAINSGIGPVEII